MADHSYKKLAQLKCYQILINQKVVEKIFSNNESINYQIPANNFFKLENQNCIGNTALHMVLEACPVDTFKTLIKHNADFTMKNNQGETVVHEAVRHIFESRKVCFWEIKGSSFYPFIEVALTAHVELGILTNPSNQYGVSHFHAACVVNNVKATELFLKNGASISDAVATNSPHFPGYTPLHFAVTYHSVEVVEFLLKNKADINIMDCNGVSPLYLIIKRIMEIIFQKKSDLERILYFSEKELISSERLINCILANCSLDQWNLTDRIVLSRLHVASMLKTTSVIKKAIEQGADLQLAINADSPFLPGYTALHFAALFNSDIVKILLKNGGNLIAKDAEGVTPFDLCLQRCDNEFIHDLIISQPAWSDITFFDGKAKLMQFVECAKKEKTIEKFLWEYGMELSVFIPHDSPIWPGYTFLHLLVTFIGMIDFCDVDDDKYDLDFTITGRGEEDIRHIEIIKNCVDRGADVTIQDVHGSTPLHLAFRNCRPKAVNELLKYCSDGKIINPLDKDGLSHLHIACAAKVDRDDESDELEKACEKLVKGLLKNGADPNHRLTSSVKWKNKCGSKVFLNVGWTALHVAVATSNLRLIKILLKNGADIYAKDINGLTPIHLILACQDNTGISNVLLSTKSLKDSVADCGLSHLHVACYVENTSAVRKLLKSGADTKTAIAYKRKVVCKHKQFPTYFRYCNVCDPSLDPLLFVSPLAACTPLHVALKMLCNAKIIGLLVQHGANVHAEKPDGTYPFYNALNTDIRDWKFYIIPMLENDETMQKCIEEHTGITMLHVYCAVLQVDNVAELLDRGANVNVKVHMDSPLWAGCTPLHLISHDHTLHVRGKSTFQGFDVIANLLLAHGADVLCQNARQDTPIHEAFQRFVRSPLLLTNRYILDPKDVNALNLTLLLENQRDFSMNPTNATGLSHFHIACLSGNVTMVEEFLKHGVNVNSPIDCFSHADGGFSPLHFAVIGQSKETVDVLLKHGADPNCRSCLDNNSLHLAVSFYLTNEDLFQSLIRAGTEMGAKNLLGQTPVDLIFENREVCKTTEIFLKYGVRVNVFDKETNEGQIAYVVLRSNGDTIFRDPLFMAPIFNPSVNGDDEMGRSPIHNIVSTSRIFIGVPDYTKAIEWYVKAGFDVDHRDKKGRTALHIAVHFKNIVGICALLYNGADVNIQDENGNTPYDYCFQYNETHKNRCFDVYKILTLHINKLQRLGLHVSHISKIRDRTTYDKFPRMPKEDYGNEVSRLSKAGIGNSVVLLDFLSETNAVSTYPTMPRVVRDAIDTFFQTNSDYLREYFPSLACLLQLQYRKAKIRMSLIDSAKASLICISAVEIPDLCSDVIVKFLSNEDLNNLIQSADVKGPPKKRMRLD